MTKYRIITLNTAAGDRYLQFQSTEVVRKFLVKKESRECWRFVPKENQYLHQEWDEESCVTSLDTILARDEWKYQSAHHEYENPLISFAKQYPDIRFYFHELNKNRDNWLRKRKIAEELPTTYL